MNDKAKKANLAIENLHLRHILDNVGAYVFTKDRKGRYTFANVMVCELFGLTLEEVIGKTDESFFDLNISNELRENDLDVLQCGERVECEERNIVASTGEERIYLTVKIPLLDEDDSVQGICGISTDITDRRRLEHQLAEQKNLLDVVLENMDAYVYMKDCQRRYQYVNGKTADLYGLRPEDILGRSDDELLPREMADKFAVLDNQVISKGIKRAGEEIVQGSNGEERHYCSNKIPFFKGDKLDGFIGVSTDISEVVRLKNEFRELARIDVLTGVLTRRFLLKHTELELKRAQRRGTRIALLLIDIDQFKAINDTYGHAFGDAFLITVVEACQKNARESDLIGRLGGDEFVITIDDADAEGMASAAERFQEAVQSASMITPDGVEISLSISMGAALSAPESSVDSLLAAADDALYEAKEAGRNCWRMTVP